MKSKVLYENTPYNPEADVLPVPETAGVLPPKLPQALWKRAEGRARRPIARQPENLETLSSEDIQKAFFELRVRQIELETERARYFDLYDLAPVGYCILSREGLILEANRTATTLLGVPQGLLGNQPLTRFILADDQETFYLHRRLIFQTGKPQTCELRMVRQDGEIFWAQLATTVVQDHEQAMVSRVMISNITERKRADEAR